jgi:hypothetical protein
MSDENNIPESNPGEASAKRYANSNIDAHLIADMLRIESISNEVTAAVKMIEVEARKSEDRSVRFQASLEQVRDTVLKNGIEHTSKINNNNEKMDQIAKDVKKIEGWIFAMIGISITGLITVVVAMFSGVSG